MGLGFDHVTVRVHSVGTAVDSYTRLLGAPPTWKGQHPELGSEGALFGLSNGVIELVGPRPSADEAEGWRQLLLERGEGLHALAFSVDDAGRFSTELRARGLRVTPPQPGEAHGADGRVRGYRTVEFSPRTTRGVSVLLVERADTAALRGASPSSTSVAHALDHVVIRTADPEAAIALYGQGLGVRLALDRMLGDRRMLFFRTGGVTIEVIEDPHAGVTDAFYGLTFRVMDIDAAHARLGSAGFTVDAMRDGMKPGTRVFSVKDGTHGVPTLFLRDPTRDGP